MTQQEFTERTGVRINAYEFDSIHDVYMYSDCDKDEFCKIWCKMNASRVALAKEQAKREAQRESIREKASRILLKIEKQMDKYNREGQISKSAVLMAKEKAFLTKNNLALESSFDCSAGALLFIIETNLNCI